MSADQRKPADTKPPAKARGLLIPVLGAAVLSAAIAGGAVYFMTPKHAAAVEGEEVAAAGGHEAASAGEGHGAAGEAKPGKKGGANYLPMAPAFVVNLDDGDASRFLQVDMEVMSRDGGALEAVKLHTPQIRNAVLMLLSQQKAKDIETREGKEALQKKVLAEFQRILTTETGKPGVDAVFFTSFVMQ